MAKVPKVSGDSMLFVPPAHDGFDVFVVEALEPAVSGEFVLVLLESQVLLFAVEGAPVLTEEEALDFVRFDFVINIVGVHTSFQTHLAGWVVVLFGVAVSKELLPIALVDPVLRAVTFGSEFSVPDPRPDRFP